MTASAEFEDFVRERGARLQQAAWLLTGSRSLAEDLVQTALYRTWAHWNGVRDTNAREAYVRKAMLNTYLSWRRRAWLREAPTEDVALHGWSMTEPQSADVRLDVLAALDKLPRRQRAVITVRYFWDLSVEETATTLGISVGAVKSQAHKAIANLRGDPVLFSLFAEETT
jgi:RNA polymerase sigma-70 factor (sigma-E family)